MARRARMRSPMATADATRASLLSIVEAEPPVTFDRSTIADLPAPARRLLERTVPEQIPLTPAFELTMRGEIRLGRRWFPFTADQLIVAGAGFVWSPIVGGRLVRFSGADVLGPHGAHIEFRLHGRVPVVKADGPDVAHSAAGRLAAETVAWLPHALTPQAGARWTGIDESRATVTLDVPGREIPVTVVVDDDGRLQQLFLQRWRDSTKPPALAAFGGAVGTLHEAEGGVVIAGSGAVGWDWNTPGQAEGEFFKYTITSARFPGAAAPNDTTKGTP